MSGIQSSVGYHSYWKPAKVTGAACFPILDKKALKTEFRSTIGVMSSSTNWSCHKKKKLLLLGFIMLRFDEYRGGCRGLPLLPMQHPKKAYINFQAWVFFSKNVVNRFSNLSERVMARWSAIRNHFIRLNKSSLVFHLYQSIGGNLPIFL